MPAEIITTDDLMELKIELFEKFESLIKEYVKPQKKRWLKSPEAQRELGVSLGTLQNLRLNGSLPYTKINSIVFYDYDDIHKMMLEGKKVVKEF